ncbi:hypothetical protein BVRB_5g105320 [Beta vulgaris subsp. vulgaris]|nr:hypothetical protein BVRB_5g105320 [Beta vulgaris subsp. vulgaris]
MAVVKEEEYEAVLESVALSSTLDDGCLFFGGFMVSFLGFTLSLALSHRQFCLCNNFWDS